MLFHDGRVHDRFTPADAAMAAEEGWDRGEREVYARGEMAHGMEWDMEVHRAVFERLNAYWFSAGPQPEEVVSRVYHAARKYRPDLLQGMSARARELAAQRSEMGQRWRLRAMFAGRNSHKTHWRERYDAIVATLKAAYDEAARPDIAPLDLTEAKGGNGLRTLNRMLELFFAGGTDLRDVARLTFTWCGWLGRDHLLNMSLQKLGEIFDETRAAQSWRAKEVVESLLKTAGCRGFRAPWQKSETAVEAYARAARGNHNRSNGTVRKRNFPKIQMHSNAQN